MGAVLIHIDPATGPVGAWRVAAGRLHCTYEQHAEWPAAVRAHTALLARGAQVPWPDWFAQLADRVPYFDDYEVVDADEATPLVDVLAAAQAAWRR